MAEIIKYQGSYVFAGRLAGRLCDSCLEPLSGVLVRLYRPRTAGDAAAALLVEAVASPKDTFAVLSDEEARSRQDDLLAEVEADDDGRFTAKLSPEQGYRGGPVEVHVVCKTVPRRKSTRPVAPVQLAITTLQPVWRGLEQATFRWEHTISARYWCGVRQRFFAWTICGAVVDSELGAPIAGLEVQAFDADWLADDALGVARTDAAGNFRIDYALEDFQKTIFAGLSFEISGPDVYFRVRTPSGRAVLDEGQSAGRRPDRENRGPCFCVTLRVKGELPAPGPEGRAPLFTEVGKYSVDPSRGHFDADGLAVEGTDRLAFTGAIPLRGILPDGNAAEPMEYRFLVAELDGTTVGAPRPVEASMLPETRIGQVEYYEWDTSGFAPRWVLRATPVTVNGASSLLRIRQPDGSTVTTPTNVPVGADGWIAVPRLNDLRFGGQGLFAAADHLAHLDTTKLTRESFDAVSPSTVAAGDPVPSGLRASGKRFRISFEARNVTTRADMGSNQLAAIRCINPTWRQIRHPSWAGGETSDHALMLVDIQQLSGAGNGCNRTGGAVTVVHTVHHPYLKSVTLSVQGNAPPPAVTATVAGGESVGRAGSPTTFSPLQPCAYILDIGVQLSLTVGYGLWIGAYRQDRIAFCAG